MQADSLLAIKCEGIRDQAPDCIWHPHRTIFVLLCRSHWTFAISGIFSPWLRREALAVRPTGSEFRNRTFRSKCGIWKLVFACLCFSVVENGSCLLHAV